MRLMQAEQVKVPQNVYDAVMQAIRDDPDWRGKTFSDVVTFVLDQWFCVTAEEAQEAQYGH